MTEDYVSFETAKLLKEKGFDAYVSSFYDDEGKFNRKEADWNWNIGSRYSAPTLQMTMKWLRETKDIQVVIGILNTIKKTWTFALFRDFDGLTQKFYSFKSYEEAAESAIMYCLENLI